ncbi:MAG: magnesium transporter [Myxococcales bacterium]|nr:magnesium transporter [Myxococcales bacterium]USN50304.1 MAG: magnesium transporter [Myxococcales bacterium]
MNFQHPAFTKEELQVLLSQNDEEVKNYITSLVHSADIIEFFREVDINEWPRLLKLIDEQELKAAVVFGFDRDERTTLLPLLSNAEIADLLRGLETDDAADLVAELPIAERIEALRLLSLKERIQVQELLRYPEDSAGGIMQLELALVREDAQISDAIKKVRQLVEEDVEVLSVLVVDHHDRLLGTLALVDLLLSKETTKVADVMDTDVVFVKPLLDQEEVAAIFRKYDLITVPVVDDSGRVLGRIVIDDVVDVLSEEAEEDALHMAGTSSEELVYPSAVFATVRLRLPWLGVALCCSLLSGLLLHFFETTLERAVVIFSFVPVITAMGGNVGTQSAALLIRGFATGKYDLSNVPSFIFKEVRVGLLMGLIYGFFAGLVGFIFLTEYNYYLGLVVLISMTGGMMTAAALGVIAPSVLKRLDIDPAIASGPFVTTLNDISGILIYMVIATLFLSHLQVG